MSPVLLLSIVSGYFLLLLGIAWWTSRGAGEHAFYSGERKSLWWVVAFGMIGTLIGLVQMLANMSDPSQIGAGMAVALLTTFYGAAMANMVFLPLAGKLDLRAKQEAQIRSLVIDGVLAIQVGEKPQIIRERLVSFLKPSQRQKAA
jgi:flagellar motor component MotA